jgi:hypothetical protein
MRMVEEVRRDAKLNSSPELREVGPGTPLDSVLPAERHELWYCTGHGTANANVMVNTEGEGYEAGTRMVILAIVRGLHHTCLSVVRFDFGARSNHYLEWGSLLSLSGHRSCSLKWVDHWIVLDNVAEHQNMMFDTPHH